MSSHHECQQGCDLLQATGHGKGEGQPLPGAGDVRHDDSSVPTAELSLLVTLEK